MGLEKYTTEELKAEIKRRTAKKCNRTYLYAEGVVTFIATGNKYFVEISSETAKEIGAVNKIGWPITEWKYIPLLTGVFNKSNAPKIGDRVKMKCLVSKTYPKWGEGNKPRIYAITQNSSLASAEIH